MRPSQRLRRPAAIPTYCSSSSSPGMTSVTILRGSLLPRPAWAARSPRRRRFTSILWCAAMRAADRRTSCMGGRRRCRQCQARRTQFSQDRHPPRPVPHRRLGRSLRRWCRLRPPMHPSPLSCDRMATFGLHREERGSIRVEPQGKGLRECSGEAPGGWLQIGDTEVAGCTAALSSAAETASGYQE